MRKKFLCVCLSALVLLCCALGGCGKVVDANEDGKQIIFISVYDGGTGTDWIKKLADDWSKENEKYTIRIRAEKNADVTSQVQAGETANSPSAYFLVGIDWTLKLGGYLEDLTDILQKKVDGEDKGTIGDKLGRTEEYRTLWNRVASDDGRGCYMLPYADSLAGWVYDHDTFKEKGWLRYADASAREQAAADGIQTELNAKNQPIVSEDSAYYDKGDRLLQPGKDGKYGTYDDGQPTDIAEWNAMMNTITKVSGAKGFIWTAANNEYLDSMAYAMAFQHAGVEAYDAFAYRDSRGKDMLMHNADGSTSLKPIVIDNAAEFYQMEGIYRAYDFMANNLLNKDYTHYSVDQGSMTVAETQGMFLLGHRGEQTAPLTAMMFDGIWWENEARPVFAGLDKPGEQETRGFGKRDYRYMLYPDMPGQKGADGEGHGTVFSCIDSGSIIVPKSKDTEKVAAVKDFIAMTLSDENLRMFTRETGVVRAYKYELTATDKEQMTPFNRTVWDIYSDTDNVAIIRPIVSDAASPFVMYGGLQIAGHFVHKIDNQERRTAIRGLQAAGNADGAFKGLYDYFSALDWSTAVAKVRQAGFYAANGR